MEGWKVGRWIALLLLFVLFAQPISAPAQITAALTHWQSSQWWRNTATLDLDFINDRYWLNGTQYSGVQNFITGAGATFSRNSVGTYFNSAGILATASANAPRLDHAPTSPYAAEGILIEESRTNSIRNNTMQGAVVSTSIAAQTIASMTDSSGTATVTTSTAHGLAVNNIVTVSGASPSNYNGTFYVASVPSSTTFTYGMATDPGANATTVGSYTAQTGGTLPTYWGIGNFSGVPYSVVGTGTEDGISYVDVKFAGTGNGSIIFNINPGSYATASQGQTWTSSAYLKLQSGSLTNVTTAQLREQETGGASTFFSTSIASISNGALATDRYTLTATLPDSGTTGVNELTYFIFGGAVNLTVRIGMPQLELGAFPTSVIPTSGSAVTRAADVFTVPTTAAGANGAWYNSAAAQGTLAGVGIIPYLPSSSLSKFPTLVSLNDGTLTNAMDLYINEGTATFPFAAELYNGGTKTYSIAASTYTAGANAKMAMAFQSSNIRAAYNSNLFYLDTSDSVPATFSQLNVGGSPYVAASLNGWVNRIWYMPTRQPDYSLPDYTR